MTPVREARIRRILYALDAATDAPDSIEAVLDLAERLQADLVGLFVEDANLLRSAALPFVRQIHLGAPGWQPLETDATERELRHRAEAARERLTRSAERRHVAFTFRVARGEAGRAIAEAAEDVDLVILEGRTRPVAGQLRLGSSARAAARHALRSVLVLRDGRMDARRLLVVYDGTAQADKALALATVLARAGDGEVVALLLAGGEADSKALAAQARALLGELGARGRVEVLGEPTLVDLCAFARRARDAVLVVGADSSFAKGQAADELMERISCPLVIVR